MLTNLASRLRTPAVPQVNVHVAKTTLSKLIEASLADEDVVIARDSKPAVRLAPIAQGKFRIGLLKGRLDGAGPDFLASMDDVDLVSWEGGV